MTGRVKDIWEKFGANLPITHFPQLLTLTSFRKATGFQLVRISAELSSL